MFNLCAPPCPLISPNRSPQTLGVLIPPRDTHPHFSRGFFLAELFWRSFLLAEFFQRGFFSAKIFWRSFFLPEFFDGVLFQWKSLQELLFSRILWQGFFSAEFLFGGIIFWQTSLTEFLFWWNYFSVELVLRIAVDFIVEAVQEINLLWCLKS